MSELSDSVPSVVEVEEVAPALAPVVEEVEEVAPALAPAVEEVEEVAPAPDAPDAPSS